MSFFKTKINKFAAWVSLHPVLSRLTVTRKIVLAYLLIALFSLVAIIYAMNSLHLQTTASAVLVDKDTRSVALARELQENLNSQERLEKQYLIQRNKEVLDLSIEKYQRFPQIWGEFLPLLESGKREEIAVYYNKYRAEGDVFQELLLTNKSSKILENAYNDRLLPAHLDLHKSMVDFRETKQKYIDTALQDLARDSAGAFRVTLILLLLGFFFATPVALSVILNIHHSLRHLTRAIMQIGSGNYDVDINLASHDEFGQLSRDFLEMSRKLREFEASNLDASPLTHLPGNLVIQRRVEELLRDNIPFGHAFVDLDHFKAYNDRYGYQNGSDIISEVGDIIKDVISKHGNKDDFVGHIGGDDYIFLTTPEKVEHLSAKIIEAFDKMIPAKYSEEDRKAGFFVCQDRFGVERQFPLMTISIAIICSDTSNYNSAIAISHECAKMKEHLKRLPGSNYLVDRRQGKS